MTYNPDVPLNGDENMSVSNPKIKTNFTALNNIFDNDHYKWNASIQAQRGYHKKISFPLAITDPVLGSQAGILYIKNDPNDDLARPQLYFENSQEIQQITNAFGSSTKDGGYWPLSNSTNGGPHKTMWVMWGNEKATPGPGFSSNVVPVVFPTITDFTPAAAGFPNSCFLVLLTVCDNDNTPNAIWFYNVIEFYIYG
jgi:hypothetical protein